MSKPLFPQLLVVDASSGTFFPLENAWIVNADELPIDCKNLLAGDASDSELSELAETYGQPAVDLYELLDSLEQ
jgi:hypothetical protein